MVTLTTIPRMTENGAECYNVCSPEVRSSMVKTKRNSFAANQSSNATKASGGDAQQSLRLSKTKPSEQQKPSLKDTNHKSQMSSHSKRKLVTTSGLKEPSTTTTNAPSGKKSRGKGIRQTETAEGMVSRGLLMLQKEATSSLERSKEAVPRRVTADDAN